MQGVVLGLAGAGNIGVVIDHLLAPRIAAAWGWQSVFGAALIPLALALALYRDFFQRTSGESSKRRNSPDYYKLLGERTLTGSASAMRLQGLRRFGHGLCDLFQRPVSSQPRTRR